MATHFTILAGKIPRTEESAGVQSFGGEESDPTEYSHIFPAIETMGEYLNREELDYQSILECYASSFKTEYIVWERNHGGVSHRDSGFLIPA